MAARSKPGALSLLLWAICLLFAWRAFEGFRGGLAWRDARFAADAGHYGATLAALDRGAEFGAHAFDAAWLRGEVQLGEWDWDEGTYDEADRTLALASEAFRRSVRYAPSSPYGWQGMAGVYRRLALKQAVGNAFDLSRLAETGEARLLPEARRALRALRLAIALAPTDYERWDDLANMYFWFGLKDEALVAVADSARVQPMYRFHAYRENESTELLQAFAKGARESLGQTPMLRREFHLLSLGMLAYRLGEFEEAKNRLTEARDATTFTRRRTEAELWLGRTWEALGDDERAEQNYVASMEEPYFHDRALAARAGIDERHERFESALEKYATLRRSAPRNLTYALAYARMAERLDRHDMVLEALRWAKTIHAGDYHPRVELLEYHLRQGDDSSAFMEFRDLARLATLDEAELERLRRKIESD
jgi:tetratricopeptide (TPR) repeat protein